MGELVNEYEKCPNCGERDVDNLEISECGEIVRCTKCGKVYVV